MFAQCAIVRIFRVRTFGVVMRSVHRAVSVCVSCKCKCPLALVPSAVVYILYLYRHQTFRRTCLTSTCCARSINYIQLYTLCSIFRYDILPPNFRLLAFCRTNACVRAQQVFGSPSAPILENPEQQTRWYFKYFLGKGKRTRCVPPVDTDSH